MFFFISLNCILAASTSPLLRIDPSLDENSNTSASSSIVTVSRVKKRPSHLKLTGNHHNLNNHQPLALHPTTTTGCPSAKAPCLQTDIDADIVATAMADRARSCSPLSLPRPSPIASDFELSVLERFDQLMASLGTSSGWSCLWFLFSIAALIETTECLFHFRSTCFHPL